MGTIVHRSCKVLVYFGFAAINAASKHLRIKGLGWQDGMLTASIYLAKARRTETLRTSLVERWGGNDGQHYADSGGVGDLRCDRAGDPDLQDEKESSALITSEK